jgi:hypothetical protein
VDEDNISLAWSTGRPRGNISLVVSIFLTTLRPKHDILVVVYMYKCKTTSGVHKYKIKTTSLAPKVFPGRRFHIVVVPHREQASALTSYRGSQPSRCPPPSSLSTIIVPHVCPLALLVCRQGLWSDVWRYHRAGILPMADHRLPHGVAFLGLARHWSVEVTRAYRPWAVPEQVCRVRFWAV